MWFSVMPTSRELQDPLSRRPLSWSHLLMRRFILALAALLSTTSAAAETLLLKPARVFDGMAMHGGWSVLVDGSKIAAVGPNLVAPAGARTIDLSGATLMPGMIEGH